MIARLIFAMLLLLLAAGCTPKPKPAPVPAPPPIQQKPLIYRKLTPRREDTVMNDCTPTKNTGPHSVNCLCRDALSEIDSKTGVLILKCKKEKP